MLKKAKKKIRGEVNYLVTENWIFGKFCKCLKVRKMSKSFIARYQSKPECVNECEMTQRLEIDHVFDLQLILHKRTGFLISVDSQGRDFPIHRYRYQMFSTEICVTPVTYTLTSILSLY